MKLLGYWCEALGEGLSDTEGNAEGHFVGKKIQEFHTEHFKFEMLERVSVEILSKVISSHLRSFEKSVYIRLVLWMRDM